MTTKPGPSDAAWALSQMYSPDVRATIRAAMPEDWQRAAERREAEDAQRRNRGGRRPAAVAAVHAVIPVQGIRCSACPVAHPGL